jgi:hypothetical protein
MYFKEDQCFNKIDVSHDSTELGLEICAGHIRIKHVT